MLKWITAILGYSYFRFGGALLGYFLGSILEHGELDFPSIKRRNEFGVAENADQALALADELDFPILVRPSYVLGGHVVSIAKYTIFHCVLASLYFSPTSLFLAF